MVRGHSVLKTMRAAGVLGKVSADRADCLAGWVGSEEVAAGFCDPGYFSIYDSRFRNNLPVLIVHLQNRFHPREGQDDSAESGQCSTAQPSAGSARHKVNSVLASH